jgi:hypothetical protein
MLLFVENVEEKTLSPIAESLSLRTVSVGLESTSKPVVEPENIDLASSSVTGC